MEKETDAPLGIGVALGKADKESNGNSSNPVDGFVFETVRVMESAGNGRNEDMEAKVDQQKSELRESVIDQKSRVPGGIGEALSQVDEGTSGNSSNLVDGFLLETVIVIDPDEAVCLSGINGISEVKDNELESSKLLVGAVGEPDSVMDPGTGDQPGTDEALGQVDQGTSENTCNSVNGVVFELVINLEENAQASRENGGFEVKENELGSSKVQVKGSKKKVPHGEKHSCVIDVKRGGGGGGCGEIWDRESVCRICHLSSEQSMETNTHSSDLIQLGCGCKDELGIAHSHCAETWFKLKGNRMCEICGETAKNITGVGDNSFMEEWNERRLTGSSSLSSNRGASCWRGQPFCNFLMACLVIAFVLPWFFRVNMF